MSEDLGEDESEVVTKEDLEPQRSKSLAFNPIISAEDFFSNDMTLPTHSLEESPCYPIIESKQDETEFETTYYCKLHPDLGSTFLTAIELHCRQKDPDSHKTAILSKTAETSETGDKT
jgi:hypothetical protein